jgi:MFS family permease
LSRIIKPRERGLFMGMQQTYGGVARAIAPLFFGWSFDRLGISSPYFIASAIIMATIFLGLGLDKYAKHEEAPVLALQESPSPQEPQTPPPTQTQPQTQP